MLRQFFKGIPDSLEESAYIDGSGDFRTFFTIILPMSVPMLITVFLFAFCWQWTDTFYTTQILMLTDIYTPLPTMVQNVKDVLEALGAENHEGLELIKGAIRNTVGIISLIPITVLFVFLQRYLVEGIERSGLTAE